MKYICCYIAWIILSFLLWSVHQGGWCLHCYIVLILCFCYCVLLLGLDINLCFFI